MKRLKQELKQTMEMYSSACKEALTAKEKVKFSVQITVRCIFIKAQNHVTLIKFVSFPDKGD